MGDQEVAVLWPPNGRAVHVLYHKPEQVIIPLKDKVPQVSLEEVFCSVEQSPRGLDRHRGDLVLGLEVGDYGGQRAAEGALAVEGTLELEVGAVPLVLLFLRQWMGLCAAHGVVAAGELEKPRHLLHAQVPLLRHGRPAGGAVGEAGEAVCADQVTLDTLLDGRRDVIQAHGALQQREQRVGVDQTQLQVGLLHHHRVHGGAGHDGLCGEVFRLNLK